MALLVPASSEKSLEDNVPLEPLVCRWLNCEQVFEDLDDMVCHIKEVHVQKQHQQFVCWWQGCGRNKKPFKFCYNLLVHMRNHSGEKPNKCSYPGCSKACSRLGNLKIHMRSHTGERPYLCQFSDCQRSFSNSSDRSKHQRTHSKEKPYACTYPNCVKCYTDSSTLRKHARTHQQPNKKARGEDKGQLDSCLMVQGIQKNDKQSPTNTPSSGATNKKPASIAVHHQPALYPTTIMTDHDLQLPHSPYHSPLMQHPIPSHSPMMQSSIGLYLTANNGQFSNLPSPMAYSPAGVMQQQYIPGGGGTIPSRPPPEYPNNGYYSPLMQASPSMQASHSPLMQVNHSPLMQHPIPSHSLMMQSSTGTYLTANDGQFSNLLSPMAYSPVSVMQQQYIPGGGACHLYPTGQDTIPSRPPPEYPNNGYYGMNTITFSHDQI